MSVLCPSDRPALGGGWPCVGWTQLVGLGLGVYLLGENNDSARRRSRWVCRRAWGSLGKVQPVG